MRTFVHTDILDHSILGRKISNANIETNSLDLIYYAYLKSSLIDTVTIRGGIIDATSIGTFEEAPVVKSTLLYASSDIRLYNRSGLKAWIDFNGNFSLYNAAGAMKVLVNPSSNSIHSYFDVYKMCFGDTSVTTTDAYFEFAKAVAFRNTAPVYMSGNFILKDIYNNPRNMNLHAYQFALMPNATWINLCEMDNDGGDSSHVPSYQLQNIQATAISVAQWGYLGAMNQEVHSAAGPTFTNMTVNNITMGGDPVLPIQSGSSNAALMDIVCSGGIDQSYTNIYYQYQVHGRAVTMIIRCPEIVRTYDGKSGNNMVNLNFHLSTPDTNLINDTDKPRSGIATLWRYTDSIHNTETAYVKILASGEIHVYSTVYRGDGDHVLEEQYFDFANGEIIHIHDIVLTYFR